MITTDTIEEKSPSTLGWIKQEDFEEMNKKVWLNNINIEVKPKLIIDNRCHSHIRALHVKSPGTERMALAKIENLWNGVFKMVDMIHPEQKVQGWECSATDPWMDWAVDELLKRGEDLSLWNCVLHSHHRMGCFWSGTDDKSRLQFNDWRFMAWSVVTAYSWAAESWAISYKGCVNFYQPYNIEIDAEVEAEWEDYWTTIEEFNKKVSERDTKINEKATEIFTKLVEENAERVREAMTPPNYQSIIDYLGLDINEDLEKNYKETVITKLPPRVFTELRSELSKRAFELAEEEVGNDLPELSQELIDWQDWNEDLMVELENHKKSYTYNYTPSKDNTYFGFKKEQKSLLPWGYDYSDVEVESNYYKTDKSVLWEGYWYTTDQYKSATELKQACYLPEEVKLRMAKGWIWEVFNPYSNDWEYLDDAIMELYDYYWIY